MNLHKGTFQAVRLHTHRLMVGPNYLKNTAPRNSTKEQNSILQACKLTKWGNDVLEPPSEAAGGRNRQGQPWLKGGQGTALLLSLLNPGSGLSKISAAAGSSGYWRPSTRRLHLEVRTGRLAISEDPLCMPRYPYEKRTATFVVCGGI